MSQVQSCAICLNEVHINGPEYFAELNSNTPKPDEYAWYYGFAAAAGSGFGTVSSNLHRIRRNASAKNFSTSNVARLEPFIQKCVAKLCSRLKEHRQDAKVVELSNAHRCFAQDVIAEYTLPRSSSFLD